jgi:hypothetical protein
MSVGLFRGALGHEPEGQNRMDASASLPEKYLHFFRNLLAWQASIFKAICVKLDWQNWWTAWLSAPGWRFEARGFLAPRSGCGRFIHRKPEVFTALRPPATFFEAFRLRQGCGGQVRLRWKLPPSRSALWRTGPPPLGSYGGQDGGTGRRDESAFGGGTGRSREAVF